MANDQVNM